MQSKTDKNGTVLYIYNRDTILVSIMAKHLKKMDQHASGDSSRMKIPQ